MEIEENEAGGATVTLEPGDDLDQTPASHRALITPAIRKLFPAPRPFFRAAADRCQFPKMAEWLRAVTEPNQWTLELHTSYGDATSAGFYWHSDVVRSAMIGLPAPQFAKAKPGVLGRLLRKRNQVQFPAEMQHYFSLVGTVDFMGFSHPGQLFDGEDLPTLSAYPTKTGVPVDPEACYLWGCTPSTNSLFFTLDGRAGWYRHGPHTVRVTGTIAQTINLVYSYFLARKAPDPDEKPVRDPKRKKVSRWGFIDRDGSLAVPLQYDHVSPFRDGLAVVKKDGLEGCIDRAGRVVIPLKFKSLGGFWDGLSSADLDGKYGYVDKSGRFVIPPQFDLAYGFYTAGCHQPSDLAQVEIADRWGYVNRAGKIVIPPSFKEVDQFAEGLALVDNSEDGNEKWFIDPQGRKVFGPFEFAESFSDGWAFVADAKGSRFIDPKGNTMLKLPANVHAEHFSEGLAEATDTKLRKKPGDDIPTGYIDKKGRWAIKPQFDSANWFHNGHAKVEINGLHGLIDQRGKYLVPPEYDDLGDLSDNRIGFSRNDRTGFMDERGRVVIEPIYELAGEFSEGLAVVCIEE